MTSGAPAWSGSSLKSYAESEGGDSHDDDSSKDGSLKGSGSIDGLNGANNGGNSDAEGVWSPDIEQSFQEALAIYPPCGRRKIILSDEGKMYGRNELIARYIKLRTGKTRTRKQVSSHIQVLARRKQREIQSKSKDLKDKSGIQSPLTIATPKPTAINRIHPTIADLAPQVTAPYPSFWPPGMHHNDLKNLCMPSSGAHYFPGANGTSPSLTNGFGPFFEGRSIATQKFRLVEFSAFMEYQEHDTDKHLFVHIGQTPTSFSDPMLESVDIRQIYDKFPEKKGLKELFDKGPQSAFFLVKFWADLSTSLPDDSGAFYGVTSQYESNDNMTIACSTKVCSFGKQVVEKVEKEYARYENGRYVYRINRSQMCEYMINFIHKLKHLPEKYMMNSVLENFTILQVITNADTQETLLCIAYVFEVSETAGTQHHIYRLTKE
ncbi:TEA domain transcription factor 1 homolog scalloped [Dermatophagoides farinae]|uniref:Transcriptional enhancer factor TEF-3 n=1 Tax=Dermatophagoides farinae TaxID=6954 RepID=A0A922HRL3_DERFA|nr:transcriptional enhancer factor TEF-1-like [Dermatophagoides farinae]KAH7643534.1 transcriptional enhancer factor tef-3-like protein [Dermatophagoides farinae]KAH9506373.1 Transcriptional enhancer factor TEF-3 [Dermatophagoides farinae]